MKACHIQNFDFLNPNLKEGTTQEERDKILSFWNRVCSIVIGDDLPLTQNDIDITPLDKMAHLAFWLHFSCPEDLLVDIPNAEDQGIHMGPIILTGDQGSDFANFAMRLSQRDPKIVSLFKNLLMDAVLTEYPSPPHTQTYLSSTYPSSAHPVHPTLTYEPASDDPRAA